MSNEVELYPEEEQSEYLPAPTDEDKKGINLETLEVAMNQEGLDEAFFARNLKDMITSESSRDKGLAMSLLARIRIMPKMAEAKLKMKEGDSKTSLLAEFGAQTLSMTVQARRRFNIEPIETAEEVEIQG